jgi:hypothetical protein
MARRKAAISEMIKSDMSRRNIGEAPKEGEAGAAQPGEEQRFEGGPEEKAQGAGAVAASGPEERAPEQPAGKAPEQPLRAGEAGGNAALLDYIAAEVEPGGSMDEGDRENFYDFMLGQAARYIRGFKAGRRFHQG